ncbi:hypothetical protein EDC01DRAFT_682427 [Geopyxis carbonaria]|nr:hypothetical protein EDC01DRAFT_682427 [Geopyxis carbonaria]
MRRSETALFFPLSCHIIPSVFFWRILAKVLYLHLHLNVTTEFPSMTTYEYNEQSQRTTRAREAARSRRGGGVEEASKGREGYCWNKRDNDIKWFYGVVGYHVSLTH